MLNKFFYTIKPGLPRKLQLFIRRNLIWSKLRKYKDVWPVLQGSEKKPDGFTGWPGGKKFALILTHDVEHSKGYERVAKLMQLEKELGFVSAFYFVPERDYSVEKKILETLTENGFEAGVHGLYHDGKLFSAYDEFLKRAGRINQYLKDWNAVGFRAPAMHHNLEWIGNLDILYDLSTFDTDPFEPQPDGVGTIFPFIVESKNHNNGSYVEIPYTLPQDFTLYVLMVETTNKIWTDKIDWIAQNNGVALVNVHPDYISFNGTPAREEYTVEIYKSFLNHIKSKYEDKFWNVLPRDMALFWQQKFRKQILK
jgi:hypothetical protein